jgi:acetoin utilization protein AcuC
MSSPDSSQSAGPENCGLEIFWDERLISYDFGPGHPMNPVRVELTMALARGLGVLDRPNVRVSAFEAAGDKLLRLVHEESYIAAVKHSGATGLPELGHGLGTPDNPVFLGMHEASALVTGASVAAAEAVWTGRAEHAANISGGLHHALSDAASGFCVYNDPAVAIAWLLENGAERVAYVDIDVHHGDGVQAAFYDDPRVLTISLHESPRTLFPGTGFPDETGADGTSVNISLPPGTGDRPWLRAFDAIVPPLLRRFRPDVLVTQQGADGHALDPLAHLILSVDGQRTAYSMLHRLAHETAGGRCTHRRRRLRAGPGRPAGVDAPARRGGGRPRPARHRDPGRVARVRPAADRGDRPAPHDGRDGDGGDQQVGGRLRPEQPGGPGGAGDAPRGVPRARPRPDDRRVKPPGTLRP